MMADFTNGYFIQGTGRVLSSFATEIKKCVGMGCLGLKRLRMYWQSLHSGNHFTVAITSQWQSLHSKSMDSSSDSDPEDAPLARGRIIPLPAIASRISEAPSGRMRHEERCPLQEGCKCEKCDMFLCFSTGKSCFKAFHTR